MDRLWRSNSSISSRTGCPLGIVNDEDHKVESCGATKSKIFKNNTLSKNNTVLPLILFWPVIVLLCSLSLRLCLPETLVLSCCVPFLPSLAPP